MQGEFNRGGGQPLLFSAVAVIGIAWLLSKIQCAICGGGGGGEWESGKSCHFAEKNNRWWFMFVSLQGPYNSVEGPRESE